MPLPAPVIRTLRWSKRCMGVSWSLFVLFLEDDMSWTGGQDFGMLFH
jgi:hypothetical protein